MTLPTNDPKTGKQWRLILLAAVVSLSMGGVFAYRFAVRSIEEKIVATLGPQGEVRELRIALTGIEMAGLRIRAPSPTEKEAAWPAEDELRVERIVVTPSLADLLRLRIVLSSVRIEGAYVSLLRARNGKVMIVPSLPARQSSAASEQSRKIATTTEAPDGKVETSGTPQPSAEPSTTRLVIEHIELHNSVVEFFDATLQKNPVKQRIEAIEAQIGQINVPDLAGQTPIRVKAIHQGVRSNGEISIEGSIELSTRESGITTVLRNVDMIPLQAYLIKTGKGGIRKGSLDFELNSSIKKGRLYAPGSLSLSDLELASPSTAILGIPHAAAMSLLKNKKGKITANFVLTGDINDPDFSLNETLTTRIATSIAGKLGVNIEGFAKNIGEASGGTATGIGKALDRLRKK